MAGFSLPYDTEREGQMEFFDSYGIPYNDDASILVDNTDGVYNGNILEFKLDIGNLNRVLFQAIKYLSRMRVKGESVPATILLVDLNATTAYVYKSEDYFDEIHRIYTGAASRGNEGFTAGKYREKIDYSGMLGASRLRKILKERKTDPEDMYLPIAIDENCIVGWAERYYRELPNASKGEFLGDDTGTAVKVKGEIREPKHFKNLIRPYGGKSNEKFKYLMDCLNDRMSKKSLGAFYTPVPYAELASRLVLEAVNRVPDGEDYIILDRCAGTGNLEAALIGLTDRNGGKLIEHCVVSTYEYYEYKVLQERIGGYVRDIIPPTEANVEYENGKVANADAMSEDFINNPVIGQYVNDRKCSVILYENPPFHDDTSNSGGNRAKRDSGMSYVKRQMKERITGPALNDLANRFIWSGFRYYMRKETDSYIVFAPLKYWKSHHIVNACADGGFLFNRAHFHSSKSAISCIYWINRESDAETVALDAYDIGSKGETVYEGKKEFRKVHYTPSRYFDRRKGGDYIGYMNCSGFNLDAASRGLVRTDDIKGHGSCFYLYRDNYLAKLPLFCAKLYPQEMWYEKDVYYTTSDGGDAYVRDRRLLKACLIYTCLSNQNKCLSSDDPLEGRYRNELCFDDSHDRKPQALEDLNRYRASKTTALDAEEAKLLEIWEQILAEARKTAEYNPELDYGVYQITRELNTSHVSGTGKTKKTVYDYPVLNGYLDTLRIKLKAYYKSHIEERMFRHELLK